MQTIEPPKRGRPRKHDTTHPRASTGIPHDCAEMLRQIRNEMQEQTGFPITVADTLRHIVFFYRKAQIK